MVAIGDGLFSGVMLVSGSVTFFFPKVAGRMFFWCSGYRWVWFSLRFLLHGHGTINICSSNTFFVRGFFPNKAEENVRELMEKTGFSSSCFLDRPKGAKWFLKGVNSPSLREPLIGTPWKVLVTSSNYCFFPLLHILDDLLTINMKLKIIPAGQQIQYCISTTKTWNKKHDPCFIPGRGLLLEGFVHLNRISKDLQRWFFWLAHFPRQTKTALNFFTVT